MVDRERSDERSFVPFGLRFSEAVPVNSEPKVDYDEMKQMGVYFGGGTPFGTTNTAFADSDTST